MFNRKKDNFSTIPKNYQPFELYLNATEVKKLSFLQQEEEQITPHILEEREVKELTKFLEVKMDVLKLVEKLENEKKVTSQRKKSLEETQNVVSNLQEIDSTSSNAMIFLKEKMELLLKEREDLSFDILNLKEELDIIEDDESLKKTIEDFLEKIIFIETESWEEDLDYYRTRFLMQREQEEDQTLKEQFKLKNSEDSNLISDQQNQSPIQQMEIFRIAIHKKHSKDLRKIILSFNQLQKISGESSTLSTMESKDTIEELITEQEKLSFGVGKILYNLKREQGILSLKTYDIIQTMKSRLLNISGSIAGRKFMKDVFIDLQALMQFQIPFDERKQQCLNLIQRLLRMLRNEPAG